VAHSCHCIVVSLSVCLFRSRPRALKNCWFDGDAVWGLDTGDPGNHVLDRERRSPMWRGNFGDHTWECPRLQSIFPILFTRGQERCSLWLPVCCSNLLNIFSVIFKVETAVDPTTMLILFYLAWRPVQECEKSSDLPLAAVTLWDIIYENLILFSLNAGFCCEWNKIQIWYVSWNWYFQVIMLKLMIE